MTARRRDGGGRERLSKRKGYVINNQLFTAYLDLAPLPANPRLLFVCLLVFLLMVVFFFLFWFFCLLFFFLVASFFVCLVLIEYVVCSVLIEHV